MIIKRYDIKFTSLKEEDIELVRKWRNDPIVYEFMEFRDHITPEMQKGWFAKIDNNENLYFVIEYDGKKIGLINGKNVNWEDMSMEGGIFIWDLDYINTQVPITCTMIMAEMGLVMGGLKTSAHILKDNERAKRYNRMVGFELAEGQEDVENQLYVMTKESYLKKSHKLRRAFYMIYGRKPIELTLEKRDYDKGIAQLIENNIDMDYLVETTELEGGNKCYYFEIELYD